MDTRQRNITLEVSKAVALVSDPVWQLELSALSVAQDGSAKTRLPGWANLLLQISAGIIALLTLAAVLLRYGGTSPGHAQKLLVDSKLVFGLHAEDTTRTRHLRQAIVRDMIGISKEKPVTLLLGRPTASVRVASNRLDCAAQLDHNRMVRPLSFGAFLVSLPDAAHQIWLGKGQIDQFQRAIPFRDRVAMTYRFIQGAAHARWWLSASHEAAIDGAIFGHTGTADTSLLEQAMQKRGIRTMHIVHGSNLGWPFAGLSDFAVFPSGADARLGASLPGYGCCTHLPLQRPEVSKGNGNWAVLTSYTHLQHPSYHADGADADILLVKMVQTAAQKLGVNPKHIFWRPHPQIQLVEPVERQRLEATVANAGFALWPDSLSYTELGAFSAVITTPSTAYTDALRLGQPAIIAKLAPLQEDMLYSANPLIAENEAELIAALERVQNQQLRKEIFDIAWRAIEPGNTPDIAAYSRLLSQSR